jgi:hypothetical protein
LTYAFPDRRFLGVYELAFGEKLGVDLANGLAWDRSGKMIRLTEEGGSDTRLALESFFRSIRRREMALADADVAYHSTMTALLALRALDTGRVVGWEEVVV